MKLHPVLCPMCSFDKFSLVHIYNTPPCREVRYPFSETNYYRELWRCNGCGHIVSVHDMDDSHLYDGEYNRSTYQGYDGIVSNYQRIMALPENKSDNLVRVGRILDFFRMKGDQNSVLDIGSGLCVFLSRMKENGWSCTAVDPDFDAIEHAEKTIGIRGISGDYSQVKVSDHFNLITFNRVLEHVRDPMELLMKAKDNLSSHGTIYIEVPDGESAIREGADREEFFIEHLHIFSMTSLAHLIQNAGYSGISIHRAVEPSSKYTLYAFLTLTGG